MLFQLGDVAVNLLSDSSQICAYWKRLFRGPEVARTVADRDLPLSLSLQLVETLSLPDPAGRLYRDAQGTLDVYAQPQGGFALHFLQGALVNLHPDHDASAAGAVTAEIFAYDRLEDVTFVSLAALLRRKGCYLVHAAAVSTARGAVLFVGPTHSGKTTTGLALLLAGWKHLASDVVILSRSDGAIVAHPTPGFINVRPPTFELLPELRHLSVGTQSGNAAGARLELEGTQWSAAAPVTAICFPQLTSDAQSKLEPLDASIALARLMEESVDRWDKAALLDHMAFLTSLSQQASHYRLLLGSDVDNLSQHLHAAL
ncbi:MAG: hypothetical protein ACOC9E_02705 [Chloroflexota bacterium]